MAIYNEMQDKGQLSEVLQRRLNMSGGAPSPALAPELFPVLVYENDRPEWGFLKGENHFGTHGTAAAAVGTHSGVGLWNPPESRIIVVVKAIRWIPISQVALVLSMSTTNPFASSYPGASRDSRFATASTLRRSNVFLGTNTDYSDPDTLPLIFATTGAAGCTQIFKYDAPIILRPGAQLVLIGSDANTAVSRVSFEWTERAAMPGELG